MKSQSCRDFSTGLRRRVRKWRIPTSGTIEVTWRYPLRCVHCYDRIPSGNGEAAGMN